MNKNSLYGYNYAVEGDAKWNARYFTKEEQRAMELAMKENNWEKLTQEEEKEYSKLKEYLKQMEKDVKIEIKKQEWIEFGKRIRETREAVENFKRYNREEFEKIRDRLTKEFWGSLEWEKEFKKLWLDKIDFIEIIDWQIYSTEEYAKIAKEKWWDYIPTKEESNKKIDFLSKTIKEWDKIDKKEKKLTPEEERENRKKHIKEALKNGWRIKFDEETKDLIKEIENEKAWENAQEIWFDKEYYLNKNEREIVKSNLEIDLKNKWFSEEEIKKEFERLWLDKIKFIEVIDWEKYSTEEYKKLAKDLDIPRISTRIFTKEEKDKMFEQLRKDWANAKPRKSWFLNKLKKILFKK